MTWLAPRIEGAPAQLRDRMLEAITRIAATDSIQNQLAEAAMVCMKRSLHENDRRERAFQLLAADALLTHASEAAAQAGSEALAQFAATWSAERFESALHD